MSTFVSEPAAARCFAGEWPTGLMVNYCSQFGSTRFAGGVRGATFGVNYAEASLHHTAEGVLIYMREGAYLIAPDQYEQVVLLVLATNTGAHGRNLAPRPQQFTGQEGAVKLQVARSHYGDRSGTRCELVIMDRNSTFVWDDGRNVFDGRVLADGRVEMTQRALTDAAYL